MLIREVLSEAQIKIPVISKERNSVIQELMEVITNKITDGDIAYKAVLEREKVMTTGVGNGIAIPHCKSSSCPEFVIALGISTNGINFNSVDNKNVNLIFLLLGPEDSPNIHIKLLSRISRIMSNKEIRTRLINSKSGNEAFQLIETAEKDLPEA